MTLAYADLRTVDERDDPVTTFALDMITYVEEVVADYAPPTAVFSFGPLAIEMRAVGETLRRCLTQAINFARSSGPNDVGSSWRILAIDGATAGVSEPPAWKFPVTSRRHLERLHYFENGQISVRYSPKARTWTAVFGEQRVAAIWTADATLLPDWYASAPCRDVFHWITLPTECFVAHTAAVGIDGKGILLTGPGGSGKSTTTAAAVMGGLSTAGDDFILIDPRTSIAYALYDSLKLDSQSAGWFSELAQHSVNTERGRDTKYRIHLSQCQSSSFVRHLPISAVFLPRVDGAARTTIFPATQGEAMRALVPSTICLIRGGEVDTIRKSSSFLRKMRAFHCDLGPNPKEVAATISAFVANLPE
jgi:hypothetical protein